MFNKNFLKNEEILELLESFSDFLISSKTHPTSEYSFLSESAVEEVARAGSGSIYMKCINDGKIYYVSSEGQSVFIAKDDSELIELVIQFPYWIDMIRMSQNFSYDELYALHLVLEEERVLDIPDYRPMQKQLIDYFSVRSLEEVLDNFITVIKRGTELTFRSTLDGNEYEKLS
jgi:hypothetical protein